MKQHRLALRDGGLGKPFFKEKVDKPVDIELLDLGKRAALKVILESLQREAVAPVGGGFDLTFVIRVPNVSPLREADAASLLFFCFKPNQILLVFVLRFLLCGCGEGFDLSFSLRGITNHDLIRPLSAGKLLEGAFFVGTFFHLWRSPSYATSTPKFLGLLVCSATHARKGARGMRIAPPK